MPPPNPPIDPSFLQSAMPLPSCHAPPGHLCGLADLPDGPGQWQRYIGRTLADAVDNLALLGLTAPGGGPLQPRFHDGTVASPGQPAVDLPIVWNAFPKKLLTRFGRDKAMVVADMLWPLSAGDSFDPLSPGSRVAIDRAPPWMRPQDEYCEWRVERDPATQRLRRITFTVESPEYWTALHGGQMPTLRIHRPPRLDPFDFRGSPQHAAALYSALLGMAVAPHEIADQKGVYAAHNRWNTTHGIVHLTHRVNALCTHVRLCADSTVCRQDAAGHLITHPEALCCAQASGDPATHADPTIVGTINALVRQGARISLPDPVGIVIDDVDTSGWALPATAAAAQPPIVPRDCLHIVRGTVGRILRLVVQAPAGSGLLLEDLVIAGEPLRHGGQIAECISVKTTVRCSLAGAATPLAVLAPVRQGHLAAANPGLLRCNGVDDVHVPGLTAAFVARP